VRDLQPNGSMCWSLPMRSIVAALNLRLSVNGEARQQSSTKDMVFDPFYLVWYLSQYMVLEPGDVINTGNPRASRLADLISRNLRPGDVVELSVGRPRHTAADDRPGLMGTSTG